MLKHYGERTRPDIEALFARGKVFHRTVEKLEDAHVGLIRASESADHHYGVFELIGGGFSTLSYQIPSTDSSIQRIRYTDPMTSHDVEFVFGAGLVGYKADKPFVHLHGVWRDRHGALTGGHINPGSVMGSPAEVVGIGFDGVALNSVLDHETSMPIFVPEKRSMPTASDESNGEDMVRAVVARLSPNENIWDAVVEICRQNGFETAMLRGGSGSVYRPSIIDGTGAVTEVDSDCSEVVGMAGVIERDTDGGYSGQISSTLVDESGRVYGGKLADTSTVSVTLELVVQEVVKKGS